MHFLMILACSLAAPDPANLLRQLKDNIARIESFECEYEYCCNARASEKPERIEVRWKPGALWYRTTPSDTSNGVRYIIEAYSDGIGEFLQAKDGSRYYNTGIKGLSFSYFNELSPLAVIGRSGPLSREFERNTLTSFVEQVTSAPAFDFEGLQVLVLSPEPADGDYDKPGRATLGAAVAFNSAGHIEWIQYFSRPPCSFLEIAAFSDGADPYMIYRVIAADYFSDFISTPHGPFPAKVTRYVWRPAANVETAAQVSQLGDLLEQNAISTCEYVTRLMLLPRDAKEEAKYEIRIDVGSVRINESSLDDKKFTIDATGSEVYWNRTTGEYRTPDGSGNYFELQEVEKKRESARLASLQRSDYTTVISIVLALVSTAVLITAYMLRRSRASA